MLLCLMVLRQLESHSALPMNFSALKRAHINRAVPEFLESDLEETFVRGTFYVKLSFIIIIILPCR
jgi:hypothetical protein